MSESKVVQKLDDLARLRQEIEGRDQAVKDEIQSHLPRASWQMIEALREEQWLLEDQAIALEAGIKISVLEGGKSARGTDLMATWNKPRVTWNAKGLDGFAVAHPEIKAFRREGNPTCSIRKAPSAKPKDPPPEAKPATPPMTEPKNKGGGLRLKVASLIAGGA